MKPKNQETCTKNKTLIKKSGHKHIIITNDKLYIYYLLIILIFSSYSFAFEIVWLVEVSKMPLRTPNVQK